ncbi:ribonuclease E [Candidatus Kinetoplastibacterium crithidii TCC036E]|uniref:Ribonuclease E n=2 Tax=Candidatus Kinetoplastidibacterium crithidiae TaxID=33056 RepID=M1L540_9PROT|nr:ribonuclease E [Candidatus Kinetoplastibacterium crithidii TCC036E]
MLFNATHPEEIRVAIVDGQKLVDLDIETSNREQRKGNIYKGVVTRIEPGLEACFINYGEDKHGFLPFKEIAKSYFRDGIDFRNTRIQDAIKDGQELIVQVEKEERGNKGAALTTFISLAGRYLVLMPNNPRGGGVSRRIEGEERQELKDIMEKLDVPNGMSIIARTAGIGRTIEELQWDLSYLLQLWNAIDQAAKENNSPVLIYLESSLIIRAIRDYFSPDINEILIDNQEIVKQAKAFMSVVMPDNVQCVKDYQNEIPLFSRFQIEHQIETAYSRMIQLPSGGSIVIDHTEALVAIDVNSAKSTRGADIEETALRTNLEASEEVARQLRLRDLGGLIVIDFIDMEDIKNQKNVEQKLREALRVDRARVQIGKKISKFGLIELSRQRLRPALNEGSHITCPRCTGIGVIRDTESSALQVLRLIQEEAMKDATSAVYAQLPVDVATYLLNEKRNDINNIELQLNIKLVLIPNKYFETPHYNIERIKNDDPKLEEHKTSFNLVEIPNNNLIWNIPESEEKHRPEALIKDSTPKKPAPIVSNIKYKSLNNSNVSKNIFKKIFSWINLFNKKEITPENQHNNHKASLHEQHNSKHRNEKKYNYKNKNQSKLLQEKQQINSIDTYNENLNKLEEDYLLSKKDKNKTKRDNQINLVENKILDHDDKKTDALDQNNLITSNGDNDKKPNIRRRNNGYRKNQKNFNMSKNSKELSNSHEIDNIDRTLSSEDNINNIDAQKNIEKMTSTTNKVEDNIIRTTVAINNLDLEYSKTKQDTVATTSHHTKNLQMVETNCQSTNEQTNDVKPEVNKRLYTKNTTNYKIKKQLTQVETKN